MLYTENGIRDDIVIHMNTINNRFVMFTDDIVIHMMTRSFVTS